jgi:hypothetical protein
MVYAYRRNVHWRLLQIPLAADDDDPLTALHGSYASGSVSFESAGADNGSMLSLIVL